MQKRWGQNVYTECDLRGKEIPGKSKCLVGCTELNLDGTERESAARPAINSAATEHTASTLKCLLKSSPTLISGFSGGLGCKTQQMGSPCCQQREEGSGRCLVGTAGDSRYQGKPAGGRGSATQNFCGLSPILASVELHEL